MAELAEAQRQSDSRLIESHIRLDIKMAELAEAQAHTEVHVNSLIDIVAGNNRRTD